MIAFTKVRLPYGWLGNMSPHAIEHGGQAWRTAEHLFQALRFADDSPVRALIRECASPMSAKMVAKAHADERTTPTYSNEDVDIMMRVLRLKFAQHPDLAAQLAATGDDVIVEDVTRRPGGSGLFWGAALGPEGWVGQNVLGKLLMDLRGELQNSLQSDGRLANGQYHPNGQNTLDEKLDALEHSGGNDGQPT